MNQQRHLQVSFLEEKSVGFFGILCFWGQVLGWSPVTGNFPAFPQDSSPGKSGSVVMVGQIQGKVTFGVELFGIFRLFPVFPVGFKPGRNHHCPVFWNSWDGGLSSAEQPKIWDAASPSSKAWMGILKENGIFAAPPEFLRGFCLPEG